MGDSWLYLPEIDLLARFLAIFYNQRVDVFPNG